MYYYWITFSNIQGIPYEVVYSDTTQIEIYSTTDALLDRISVSTNETNGILQVTLVKRKLNFFYTNFQRTTVVDVMVFLVQTVTMALAFVQTLELPLPLCLVAIVRKP